MVVIHTEKTHWRNEVIHVCINTNEHTYGTPMNYVLDVWFEIFVKW